MEAPSVLGADCSLQTALTGVDAEYPISGAPGARATRRCRFSWGGLANLLGNRIGGISDLVVHAEVAHDVCETAVTGARFSPPLETRLSRTTAAYALPSASVYIQGSLASLMQAPRPCATRLDCDAIPGVPADQVDCVDLDRRMFALSNLFTGKDVNPFAEFSIGSYNTGGQQCGGAEDLRGSLRTLVRSLGGMRRDAVLTSPSFCMYSPTRVADFAQSGNDGRRAIFDERRTCALQNYSDPRRLCLASTMQAQPSFGPDFSTVVTGNPVRINNMFGGPVVAPRPGVGGVEPFTPSSRIGSTPGFVGNGGNDADFTISVPAVTRAGFTNNLKERLRWGLAQALSQFGVPTPPEAVLIKSVTDNGDAFSPLPGGGRAGVTVTFAVESPDAAARRNVTAQFASGLPGTLGRSAGPVLVALGLVPLLRQFEIQFRELPKPPPPPAGLDGGTLFGVLLLVALLLSGASYVLHLFVLKPRGVRVPFVPAPDVIYGCVCALAGLVTGGRVGGGRKQLAASTAGKGGKTAAGGGDDDGSRTPVKKVANPLNTAAAGAKPSTAAPAATAAATSSSSSAGAPAADAQAAALAAAEAGAPPSGSDEAVAAAGSASSVEVVVGGGGGSGSEQGTVDTTTAAAADVSVVRNLTVVANPLAAAAAAAAAAGAVADAAASSSSSSSNSSSADEDGSGAVSSSTESSAFDSGAGASAAFPAAATAEGGLLQPLLANSFAGGEYPSLPTLAPVPMPPPPPPSAAAAAAASPVTSARSAIAEPPTEAPLEDAAATEAAVPSAEATEAAAAAAAAAGAPAEEGEGGAPA